MNTNIKKWVVMAVLVVVVIVLVVVLVGMSKPTTQTPSENAALTTSTAGTVAGNTPGSGKATGPAYPSNALTPTPDVTSPIHFITPPAGDRWPQASQNTISWNHGSGSTGQLYLINAATKKTVGVILDQVGPDQTYYTWNTRDLYVSRTSPTKITVPLGTYMIGFSFDQNHLPTITSQTFTIVAPLPK